jgi:hypothetical protein
VSMKRVIMGRPLGGETEDPNGDWQAQNSPIYSLVAFTNWTGKATQALADLWPRITTAPLLFGARTALGRWVEQGRCRAAVQAPPGLWPRQVPVP